MHPALVTLAEQHKALYDSVEIGKSYLFNLTGSGMDKPWRSETYKVLGKKKHTEFTYSILCEGEGGGVIYHWIDHCHTTLSERILSIQPVQIT